MEPGGHPQPPSLATPPTPQSHFYRPAAHCVTGAWPGIGLAGPWGAHPPERPSRPTAVRRLDGPPAPGLLSGLATARWPRHPSHGLKGFGRAGDIPNTPVRMGAPCPTRTNCHPQNGLPVGRPAPASTRGPDCRHVEGAGEGWFPYPRSCSFQGGERRGLPETEVVREGLLYCGPEAGQLPFCATEVLTTLPNGHLRLHNQQACRHPLGHHD